MKFFNIFCEERQGESRSYYDVIIAFKALSATLTCNNSTQFDCQTLGDPHRCIPLEWLCDGLRDCKSGLVRAAFT